MLSVLALSTVASLTLLASAGQIPVVDGVIGGVPSSTSPEDASRIVEDVVQVSGTPVAGKMRFITNSGVCGTPPLSRTHNIYSLYVHRRNHPRSLSSIRLRRLDSHAKHVVRKRRRCLSFDALMFTSGSGSLLLVITPRRHLLPSG